MNDENILLAGAVSGGMWRSTNGGNSWSKVSAPNVNQSVTCIAQDKRSAHRNTWYYGSGEAYGASASGGSAFHLGSGVFKSNDNGISWTKLGSTGGNTPQTFDTVWDLVWNVATDSSNASQEEIYAATYGGIFRSVNGGTSWTLVRGSNSNTPFSYFTDVDISPSFLDTANRMVIGIDPNNENEIYFLAETPGSGKTTTNYAGTPEQNSLWKYTYLSGNGSGAGGTWIDRSVNLPDSGGIFDKFNSQGGYDLVVRVQPGNSNVVIIGGTNLYRSTDAFTSKTNTSQIGGYGIGSGIPFYSLYPNHHPDQHAVVFSTTNPNTMYSACDGGVLKTTDILAPAVVWNSLNQGYLSTQFYTVAIDNASAGDSVIIAGAQDNGTLYSNSLNPNFAWTQPSLGDGSYCAIADGGSNYYYSRQEGKLIKTTMGSNGLTTGYVRIDPLMADTTKYGFIAPFVLDPNGSNILYLACGDMIYRNDDLAQIAVNNNYLRTNQNWDSLSFTYDPNANITALAISKSPSNRLYYGTNKGKIYRVDNANSGNPVPVNISTAAFPTTAYVSCIAVHPNDANKVLLVFSNYNIYSLYYTSDGGSNWIKVGGNLEPNQAGTGASPSLRWASILPLANGTAYFVASSTGVYATDTLNGLTTVWTQQSATGIGSVVSDVIVSRPLDGMVVIGTHGNGIYTTSITDINQLITGTAYQSSIEKSKLGIYPNPFSNSAQIDFVINESAQVRLQILDELGQEVITLLDQSLAPGKYNETFERKNLPAGAYYCSLTVNGQKSVRMIVAK